MQAVERLDQLPASALAGILLWLPDPAAAAASCKALAEPLLSPAFKLQYACRWCPRGWAAPVKANTPAGSAGDARLAGLRPMGQGPPSRGHVATTAETAGRSRAAAQPVTRAAAAHPVFQLVTWRAMHGASALELATFLLAYTEAMLAESARGGLGAWPWEWCAESAAQAAAALRQVQAAAALLHLAPGPWPELMLAYCARGGHTEAAHLLAAELAAARGPWRVLPGPAACSRSRRALALYEACRAGHAKVVTSLLEIDGGQGAGTAAAGPRGGAAQGLGHIGDEDPTVEEDERGMELAQELSIMLDLSCARGDAACMEVLMQRTAPTSTSWYGLVAAAGSGSGAALDLMMSWLPEMMVKQQLPSALKAAGAAGDERALRVLLALPLVSSRPLQLAAEHAGAYGWPPGTLDELLGTMLARHRSQLDDIVPQVNPKGR
jgi:hypothetical protein